ncbi:hypothetical protein NMY22_g1889 [Coprinellus aureogranulatus]|nr:hypothetical protein NMY22_g1889 [Coprinellus aureogranulatus]
MHHMMPDDRALVFPNAPTSSFLRSFIRPIRQTPSTEEQSAPNTRSNDKRLTMKKDEMAGPTTTALDRAVAWDAGKAGEAEALYQEALSLSSSRAPILWMRPWKDVLREVRLSPISLPPSVVPLRSHPLSLAVPSHAPHCTYFLVPPIAVGWLPLPAVCNQGRHRALSSSRSFVLHVRHQVPKAHSRSRSSFSSLLTRGVSLFGGDVARETSLKRRRGGTSSGFLLFPFPSTHELQPLIPGYGWLSTRLRQSPFHEFGGLQNASLSFLDSFSWFQPTHRRGFTPTSPIFRHRSRQSWASSSLRWPSPYYPFRFHLPRSEWDGWSVLNLLITVARSIGLPGPSFVSSRTCAIVYDTA